MTIKEELNQLKTTDIYSMLLFMLYKLSDTEEYSVLSELVYILDKDNLLNLCEYFGGLTITIPTIDELESVLNSVMLYQYVNIDNIPYTEAIKKIGFESSELRQVKKDYAAISKILNDYSFSRE